MFRKENGSVTRKENGSETSSPFRKLWQIDRLTNQLADRPTDRPGHEEVNHLKARIFDSFSHLSSLSLFHTHTQTQHYLSKISTYIPGYKYDRVCQNVGQNEVKQVMLELELYV